MQNLLDELKREMKVELLNAVLRPETLKGYYTSGTKMLTFPDRLVYFVIDFTGFEDEEGYHVEEYPDIPDSTDSVPVLAFVYPDILLMAVTDEKGSSEIVWSIDGPDLARKHLKEVIRYDILPHLEDKGIELKDIIGFYISWLATMRSTRELDAIQKTVSYQAIPNDDDNKYLIVFKTTVSEKKQKDDVYNVLKYSLSFDKVKYNVTTPFPIILDERTRIFQKMVDEIESFLKRVDEEVDKILNR